MRLATENEDAMSVNASWERGADVGWEELLMASVDVAGMESLTTT